MLDIARMQAGHAIHLNLQPTDLVELARRVTADYQQTTSHRFHLETAVPELFGVWDESRLERILGNLLSNALKYSPADSDIIVRADSDDATGALALLSVQDQGIGIPPADLPHIFERFYRASNAAGKHPGTGLGLAGVRQIVELHGGSIGVTSDVGRGTTFTVRLPIVQNGGPGSFRGGRRLPLTMSQPE